jgi:hypothetical protein
MINQHKEHKELMGFTVPSGNSELNKLPFDFFNERLRDVFARFR